MAAELSASTRESFRKRPAGLPIMRQSWGRLLFMHWPIDVAALRPLIPPRLEIDLYDGQAWIGVIPFTMWNVRPTGLPPFPGNGAFHELNVRTYVHHRGEPGVWFFSLDAARRLPVHAARWSFALPYYFARMRLERNADTIDYESARRDTRSEPATFAARWRIGEPLPTSDPESLTYFLTERYCLYANKRGRLIQAHIWHDRWPLHNAAVEHWESSMVSVLGLPEPTTSPLLHYADELHVKVWRPRQLKIAAAAL